VDEGGTPRGGFEEIVRSSDVSEENRDMFRLR
jgi:hypothetical protein